MANPQFPQPNKQPQPKFGISMGAVLVSLLLLCQIAIGRWYSRLQRQMVFDSRLPLCGRELPSYNRSCYRGLQPRRNS